MAAPKNASMSPWDVVERELQRRGRKPAWLASRLGVTSQRLGNWKSRGIPAAQMRAVATALGLSVDQLDGLAPIEGLPLTAAQDEIVQIRRHEVVGAPLEGTIRFLVTDAAWIQANVRGLVAPRHLSVVTAFDDSMMPMFGRGDPLLVNTGVRHAEQDGVYMFRAEDRVYIRRLQHVPQRGLVVSAESRRFRDWVVAPNVRLEILGLVVKAWRGSDL